jgi:hypothetical protein
MPHFAGQSTMALHGNFLNPCMAIQKRLKKLKVTDRKIYNQETKHNKQIGVTIQNKYSPPPPCLSLASLAEQIKIVPHC